MNLDGSMTKQQPPNNKLFDTTHITHMSPVIAHQKADQAAQFAAVMASNPQDPPVFNILLGNNFASMFQPQPPALPPPSALPALPVQPHWAISMTKAAWWSLFLSCAMHLSFL